MCIRDSYTTALQFLEANFEELCDEGLAGSNAFEQLCAEQGIYPTEEDLSNPEAVYDWFCALYYSRPQVLWHVLDPEIRTAIVKAMLAVAAEDLDQREFVESILTYPGKWAKYAAETGRRHY